MINNHRQVHPRAHIIPNSPYDAPPKFQQMADAISAATIAAVDRHFAHLGLYPRSDSTGLAPVAPPPPTDGCCGPHNTLLRSRTVLCCGPCSLTVHFRGRRPCSSAPPRRTGAVDPSTHPSAPVKYSAAAPTPLQYTSAGLAPVVPLPRQTGGVDPPHTLPPPYNTLSRPPLPYSTLLHCSLWLRPPRRFLPPPLRCSGGKRQPLLRPISRLVSPMLHSSPWLRPPRVLTLPRVPCGSWWHKRPHHSAFLRQADQDAYIYAQDKSI